MVTSRRITIREVLRADDPASGKAHDLISRTFRKTELVGRGEWRRTLEEREAGFETDVRWHLVVAERAGAVRSKATTVVNLDAGYKLTRSVRVALDVFNLLNAKDSDIDYYYASRLPGEGPAGIDDLHFHPALPRTARVLLIVGF